MNGISIVIPYFKDIQINNCIFKLLNEYNKLQKNKKKLYEIIIINDGSKKLKNFSNNSIIKIINKSKNVGVGKTRNIGLKIAKKKYVLFLDSDVIVSNNFFKKLLKLINNTKKKIFYFTPSFVAANKNPTFYHRYLAGTWFINHTKDFKSKEVISSFCLLAEKKYLLKIGGFSDKFKKAGGEEFELISRIEKKLIKQSNINVLHYQDSFFIRSRKLFSRSQNYSQTIVINKNISIKTKFFYAFKLLNSFFLILSFAGIFFLKLNLNYFLFSGLIYIFLEKNFFIFLLSKKMFGLFILSMIFRLLENLTIAYGLALSYVKKMYRVVFGLNWKPPNY